jgi:hypothetical protein
MFLSHSSLDLLLSFSPTVLAFIVFLFIYLFVFYWEIDINYNNNDNYDDDDDDDRKEQILKLLSNILFSHFVLLPTSDNNNNNSSSSSSSSSSKIINNSLPLPLYNALNKLGIIVNKLSSTSEGFSFLLFFFQFVYIMRFF